MCIKLWVRSGINAYRFAHKATISDVAKKLDVSRITVSHWLSYTKDKTPNTLNQKKLIKILGLNPNFKKGKIKPVNLKSKKIGHFYKLDALLNKYRDIACAGENEAIKHTQKIAYKLWSEINFDFPVTTKLELWGNKQNEYKCNVEIKPIELPITFIFALIPGKEKVEYELYWKLDDLPAADRIRFGVLCAAVIHKFLKSIKQLIKDNQKFKFVFNYDLFKSKIQEIQWL